MEGARVVVNLAGASINKRWTKACKRELYDSRIPVTRRVVEAIRRMPVAPERITQRHLADVLARADGIRWRVRLGKSLFRLLMGERSSFLTQGQQVLPAKLTESGFTYLYPTIEKLMGVTDHRTVRQLNINRYMGLWHEIARYENRFEKGMTSVTATYTLLPGNKIRVENKGLKGTRPRKAAGRAKQPDPENNPGKLKVAFFLWFYADYYILELDEAYRYAIVGSSSDKYLWILSREKKLPPPLLDELLQHIKDRGYDTAPLLFAK